MDFIRSHDVLVVACLAVLEGFFCALLLRRVERMKARLRVAVAAAEDAARAAALSLPGGIDPEVVISLLRSGRPTSLESVYQLMEQQTAREEAERQERLAAITATSAKPPTSPSPPSDTPPSGGRGDSASKETAKADESDMERRLGRYGG